MLNYKYKGVKRQDVQKEHTGLLPKNGETIFFFKYNLRVVSYSTTPSCVPKDFVWIKSKYEK